MLEPPVIPPPPPPISIVYWVLGLLVLLLRNMNHLSPRILLGVPCISHHRSIRIVSGRPLPVHVPTTIQVQPEESVSESSTESSPEPFVIRPSVASVVPDVVHLLLGTLPPLQWPSSKHHPVPYGSSSANCCSYTTAASSCHGPRRAVNGAISRRISASCHRNTNNTAECCPSTNANHRSAQIQPSSEPSPSWVPFTDQRL